MGSLHAAGRRNKTCSWSQVRATTNCL